MGTFSENLAVFKWSGSVLVVGVLVFWYCGRLTRGLGLNPYGAWDAALYVLRIIVAEFASLAGVLALVAAAILLYLSFGIAWFLAPLVLLLAGLIGVAEWRIRANRQHS